MWGVIVDNLYPWVGCLTLDPNLTQGVVKGHSSSQEMGIKNTPIPQYMVQGHNIS